jgi:hypothetical protein
MLGPVVWILAYIGNSPGGGEIVEIIWRKRGEMVPSGDFMEISVPRYGGKQAQWRKHGDYCDYVKQIKIMSKVCL